MAKSKKSTKKTTHKPNKTAAKVTKALTKIKETVTKSNKINPEVADLKQKRSRKNAPCPRCGAFPCVTVSRTATQSVLRCRECDGPNFEVGR